MEGIVLARHFFLFLFGAGAGKSAVHADVAFMAGVLEHSALALRDGNLDRPGSVPGRGIFDSELIEKRVGIETAEAFGQFQVLAASAERILVRDWTPIAPAAVRVRRRSAVELFHLWDR